MVQSRWCFGCRADGEWDCACFCTARIPSSAVRCFSAQIEKALKTIEKNLDGRLKKGLIPADSIPAILGRITVVKDLSGLR